MIYSITEQSSSGIWDQVLQERSAYYPGVEYFMVDYFDEDHGAHIQLPFLRQNQVFQVCNNLQVAIQGGASIRAITVLPEAFLDEPNGNPDIVEKAIAAGVEGAKYWSATTREVLFDPQYEAIGKRFKNKEIGNFEVQ